MSIEEDLDDLYENAPCGYLSLGPDGRILKLNATLASWLGRPKDELLGRRFTDLLKIAGRIFYETHVAPLLRMQGRFDEFALDMVANGDRPLAVLANAVERRSTDGQLLFTRYTIFKATDRRRYERDLVSARNDAERLGREVQERFDSMELVLKSEREIADLREQFIAVLGHDLRNPLASMSAGARLMLAAQTADDRAKLERMMQGSVNRMAKLIDSVMDFARGRLGGGFALKEKLPTDLTPVLMQVVDELAIDHPDRKVDVELHLGRPVACDPARISQLVSNLLANALTHGDPVQPVRLRASTHASSFELSIANAGAKISDEALAHLFQPFYRGKAGTSKQGLGLGLYIAAEIAKAHNGWLDADSNDTETRFTLIMPLEDSRPRQVD